MNHVAHIGPRTFLQLRTNDTVHLGGMVLHFVGVVTVFAHLPVIAKAATGNHRALGGFVGVLLGVPAFVAHLVEVFKVYLIIV